MGPPVEVSRSHSNERRMLQLLCERVYCLILSIFKLHTTDWREILTTWLCCACWKLIHFQSSLTESRFCMSPTVRCAIPGQINHAHWTTKEKCKVLVYLPNKLLYSTLGHLQPFLAVLWTFRGKWWPFSKFEFGIIYIWSMLFQQKLNQFKKNS